METWYITTSFGTPWIRKVQVVSHTASFVVVVDGANKPYRKAKVSDYENYFPTFEEAKAHLLYKFHAQMVSAEQRKAYALEKQQEIQALTPPWRSPSTPWTTYPNDETVVRVVESFRPKTGYSSRILYEYKGTMRQVAKLRSTASEIAIAAGVRLRDHITRKWSAQEISDAINKVK